jgi:subtilisin family serine protease
LTSHLHLLKVVSFREAEEKVFMTPYKTRAVCAAIVAGLAGLLAAAPATAAPEQASRVIVKFKAGTFAKGKALIGRLGGRVLVDLREVDALATRLSPKAIAFMARHPSVEFVEPDGEMTMMGNRTARRGGAVAAASMAERVPYGIPMVQADLVSDGQTANRKVCIIDSGYDVQHEDLGTGANVTGENLSDTPDWNTDQQGHGTHVAGTIAALGGNGVGVVGVMPSGLVDLHIVKVFGSTGSVSSSTVAKAGIRCLQARANVVSMSLGGAGGSRLQEIVFGFLERRGILNIAAAGNSGDSTISFPAGFPSVMSVAAIDSNMAWASFSQFNETVEIAAPGVAVESTVPMGTGDQDVSFVAGGTSFPVLGIDGTPSGDVVATLADFGLGLAPDAAMSGKLCITSRGDIAFSDKVLNCQASGGVGSVIYNNESGPLLATLGGVVTAIPSAGAAGEDGAALVGLAASGATGRLTVGSAGNYSFYNGTSMATPHVAAVAALVWSYHPECNAGQIRAALNASAMDIDVAGRDDRTGSGLVQAQAALSYLDSNSCAPAR